MAHPKQSCTGKADRPAAPASALADEYPVRGEVRQSRSGRRRAWVLLLVHVLIFAHILHWILSGRTLSPLEPSEAMYTIANGAFNAGAILLLLSLASTLVFGRWFCGWACHLVALQDGSAWLLKKVGIHPRPLRSRWLLIVPLLAGIHLFFMPLFMRWWLDLPSPGMRMELTKEAFWETFPGFWVGLLTFLTTGFFMIYVLGSKGFCTYACPYGGLFGVMDRLAPGRIRVTDACKGCGHCTATCTSNVVVHKEVHEYGMVVDPGCMKCMDCVSVCPENALYFGFGRPALGASPRVKHPKPRHRSFTRAEEATLLVTFALALFVFRGVPEEFLPWAVPLYGLVPLLFALGLSALVAAFVLFAWRLLRRPGVTFIKWTLKQEGRLTTPGRLAATGIALGLLLFLHSACVQVMVWRGKAHLEETAPLVAAAWTQDRSALDAAPAGARDAVLKGERILTLAQQIGLVRDVRLTRTLAWFALCRGDLDLAIARLEEALTLEPTSSTSLYDLGYLRLVQGRPREALPLFELAREHNPSHGRFEHPEVMALQDLIHRGDFPRALAWADVLVTHRADDLFLQLDRARLLLIVERRDDGYSVIGDVLTRLPDGEAARPVTNALLPLLQVDPPLAIATVEAAMTRGTHPWLPIVLAQAHHFEGLRRHALGDRPGAHHHLQRAHDLFPDKFPAPSP